MKVDGYTYTQISKPFDRYEDAEKFMEAMENSIEYSVHLLTITQLMKFSNFK